MKISLNKPRRLNKSSKHTGYAGLISSLCLDKYLVKPRESYFILTSNDIDFFHASIRICKNVEIVWRIIFE